MKKLIFPFICSLLMGVYCAEAQPNRFGQPGGSPLGPNTLGSVPGFEGLGGIAVSTNANGGIVIDGSGISAGSLPAFSITNRYAVGNTFTNLGLQRQQNHIIISSNLFVLGSSGFGDNVNFTNNVGIQGDLSLPGHVNVKDTLDEVERKIANINGLGTNLLLYGNLSIMGPVGFHDVVNFTNNVGIQGDLSLPGYGNVKDTLDLIANKVDNLNGLSTNLTVYKALTISYSTANRPAFINAQGIITNASGTPDGTKFLRDDGVLATPAGGGDVTKVGTPVNDQLAVWTGDGTLEGEAQLTYVDNVLINTHGSGSGFRAILTGINRTNIYGAAEMIASGDYSIRVGGADGVGVTGLFSDTVFNYQTNLYIGGDYIHTRGTVITAGYNTTNSTPGSNTAAVTIRETNLVNSVRVQGAHQMTRSVTNIVGLIETNDAAVFFTEANQIHNVYGTNLMSQNGSMVLTNGAPGQEFKGRFIGASAGGPYTMAFIVPVGSLIRQSYDLSAGSVTSITRTVTNGFVLEYNVVVGYEQGTNIYYYLDSYYKR